MYMALGMVDLGTQCRSQRTHWHWALPSTLFETGPLVHCCLSQASVKLDSQASVEFLVPASHLTVGVLQSVTGACRHGCLYLGSEESNSGPHTCALNVLPMEPSPQPGVLPRCV